MNMNIYELKVWVFWMGVLLGAYLVIGLYQSLGWLPGGR